MGLRAPPMLGSCGAVGVVEWFYGTADPDFLRRSGLTSPPRGLEHAERGARSGASIVERPFGSKVRCARNCGMAAFAAPYLSEYAEMDNDLGSCMDRILTHDALVKTGRPGDCVATQLGGFRGWDAARWTSPTPLCSSSSHCSTRDRFSSLAHRLVAMVGSKESKLSSSSGRCSAPAVARRDTVKVHGGSSVRDWMESFIAVSGPCSSIATGGSAVLDRRDLLFVLSTRGSPSFEPVNHHGRGARGRAFALGTAVTLGANAGTDHVARGARGLRFRATYAPSGHRTTKICNPPLAREAGGNSAPILALHHRFKLARSRLIWLPMQSMAATPPP